MEFEQRLQRALQGLLIYSWNFGVDFDQIWTKMGNFKKMKTLQQVEQDEHDAQVKAEDEEMKKETKDEIEILGIPEVIGEDIEEVHGLWCLCVWWEIITMWCCYNVVNFHPNPYKSSSIRARYGVSFVIITSDAYFDLVIVIPYAKL